MGSEAFYPEEGPVRRAEVGGFWIDEHPVTADEFRRFVRETGYTTLAERPLDPADYPDADPALLVPGSLVFRKTSGPVPLNDVRSWWEYVPGAFWKKPGGRARRSTAAIATPSSRSPTRTLRRTPPGPARHFRPRPSGNTPHAAASREPRSHGATSISRTGSRWRTPGKASSHGRTSRPTGSTARHRSGAFLRTVTGSTT